MPQQAKKRAELLVRYQRFAKHLGLADADAQPKFVCKKFIKGFGLSLNDATRVMRSKTPIADLNRRLPQGAPMPVAPKPSLADERRHEERRIAEFYDSWDWRRLSYDTRKRLGQRCQCCGATPEQHGVRIVCDHIKPVRRFWNLRLEPTNLQVLCDDCNRGKASHDDTDWRAA